MENENKKLKTEVEELKKKIDSLYAASTIPYNVDVAFRKRFEIESFSKQTIAVSTKDADSEDVSIDEAGSAVVTAMGDPNGFLEIIIGGTTYYLPYFT